MKKIEAIVKPSKMEPVREALANLGINGITLTQVAGCARSQELSGFAPKGTFANDVCPKIKVEFFVSDVLAGPVASTIVETAHTGSANDGSVCIFPVEEVISIQSREPYELAVHQFSPLAAQTALVN